MEQENVALLQGGMSQEPLDVRVAETWKKKSLYVGVGAGFLSLAFPVLFPVAVIEGVEWYGSDKYIKWRTSSIQTYQETAHTFAHVLPKEQVVYQKPAA